MAEARATALIGDDKAPAAEGAQLAGPPAKIGGAGAEDRDRAVIMAESALQRDHAIRDDFRPPEGKLCHEPLGDAFDIGAREAQQRVGGGIAFGIEAGIGEGGLQGADDIDQRAVEIGENVGGTAPGHAEHGTIGRRNSRPAARYTSIPIK